MKICIVGIGLIGGSIARFSARFANRYLDPESLHRPERGGPRRGRRLSAP